MTANVHADHLVPNRPIVGKPLPFAEGVPDPLAPQLPREFSVLVNESIAIPDREDHILTTELLESPVIVFVRDEVHGVLEVDRLVMVTAQEPSNVGQPAHAEDSVHLVRVP